LVSIRSPCGSRQNHKSRLDTYAVLINGSFVTRKPRPGDYDLCWSIEGVVPERLDPVLLDFSPSGRRTMKAKYRGDLFPAEVPEGASG